MDKLTVHFKPEEYDELQNKLHEALDTLADIADEYLFDFLFSHMEKENRTEWVTGLYIKGKW